MSSKLLSKWERENLPSRDALAPEIKKVVDFRSRKKLKAWLENRSDVEFILRYLPRKQLKKIINNITLSDIFTLMNQILRTARIPKIVDGEYVRPHFPANPSYFGLSRADESTMMMDGVGQGFSYTEAKMLSDLHTRKATPEELERVELLKNHIHDLMNLLSGDDTVSLIDDILKDFGDSYRLIDNETYEKYKKVFDVVIEIQKKEDGDAAKESERVS